MCYGRKTTVELNKIIMKQLFFITITLITFFSCKAQQPIIPLYNGVDLYETENAYYKDIDGDFTKLVATWEYSNDNEIFKIILKKKSFYLYEEDNDISFYEDILYGEFKYVDSNGTEVINTVNDIDNFNDISQHLIYGGYIKDKYSKPFCDDCLENERRVEVSVKDPLRSYFNYEMEIRHIPAQLGNPEQIKIKIKLSDMSIVPEGQPDDDRIPTHQEIILTKQ